MRIITKKQAALKCRGVHPNTIMRWVREQRYAHLAFPKPVQVADGSVGFFEHEVDAWLASRPRVSSSESEAA